MSFTTPAYAFSQDKITLSVTDMRIKDVLKEIEKQSKYRFIYSSSTLSVNKRVSVNIKDENVFTALDNVFGTGTIDAEITNGNLVTVKSKIENKNDITVKGKVTGGDGNGLPGVTVVVISSTKKGQSAITDVNGEYSITAPKDAVLRFTFVGYEQKEVSIDERSEVNVSLIRKENTLGDVVVVGYGTQRKKDLTGAVASVGGDVLESRPLVNLAQGLQGMVPNLNISLGNGAPGKGATFNIRGTTSINGGSPLVLVDGVQMDPNLINPADVASISVLKDAGSAAIYGGRAAFGVVLITTKTGSVKDKATITINSSYNTSRQTYLPEYVSSVDYVRMFMEADRTGRGGGFAASSPLNTLDSINTAKYYADPVNNLPVYVDPINTRMYRYVGNTDWLKILFPGWAPSYNNDVSLSGGSAKIKYYVGLGAFNQTGMVKLADQQFSRYNATIKLDASPVNWLDLNFKAVVNNSNLNTANLPGATGAAPTYDYSFIASDLRPIMPVYHPDGNYSGQGNNTNMVAVMAQNGRLKWSISDLWLTGGFVIKPVKNFRIVGDLTWNGYYQNNFQQFKSYREYGANGVLIGTFPWTTPNRVMRENVNNKYYALNFYGEYANTFGDHSIKVTAGYNGEGKLYDSYGVTVRNQLDPTLESITPSADATAVSASVDVPTPVLSQWKLMAGFFRINYGFKNKYLLQLTGRQDGSSRYAYDNRTIFTPTASVAWNIAEEGFFKPLSSVIDNLKIRASYGTLPNQLPQNTTDNYPYIATMPTAQTSYLFNGQLGNTVSAPGLVSSSFTWEKVTTQNLGVDLTLFKNRLSVVFDIYRRDTKGMLTAGQQVPAVLGTSVPRINSADLRNKGWELTIGWNDQLANGLRYNASLGLSDYKAYITRYQNNPNGLISDYYVGRRIGEVWGYTTEGYFTTDAEAATINQSALWAGGGGGKMLAGDIKYVDMNHDGIINNGTNTLSNSGDIKIIGNNEPRYMFGLNLGAEFKGFDFSMFTQGVLKRDFWLSGNYFWGFGASQWQVPTTGNLDHWTPTNTDAYFPRLRLQANGNQVTQTKYKQNAAYARIKQITLGYTLNQQLLQRIGINRLRIYVTGQNLFTISNIYQGFDPELLGVNTATYPLSKTYSFGIQVGL